MELVRRNDLHYQIGSHSEESLAVACAAWWKPSGGYECQVRRQHGIRLTRLADHIACLRQSDGSKLAR